MHAIEDGGKCVLGLSGGSTPKPIYTELGKSTDIDWSKVTVFLVDERYVSADDTDSNQHMVRETLLANAAVPENQIIFPDTSLSLDDCVARYDQHIADLEQDNDIDVLTLGMGPDGHIASLFPGDIDSILEMEEHVIHTQTEQFAVRDRITVTLPLLVNAEVMHFMMKGDDKKAKFAEVLSANMDSIEYPAHSLLDTGRTVWVTQW